MKSPDQVLALRGIDPGLAPHRTVHLRQKRCRDLHKTHPAPQHRSGKAGQIPDHPASQRHHQITPFHLLLQQPFDSAFKMRPALGAFPGRQNQRLAGDALIRQPVAQRLQMQRRHVFIGDHTYPFARQTRPDQHARLGKQAGADMNVIGPLAQTHMNRFTHRHTSFNTSGRVFSASTTRSAVCSIEQPASVFTGRSANA